MGMNDRDPLARVLELQARTIRRTARWWMTAVERVQGGDLAPGTWLDAQAQFVNGVIEDSEELLRKERPRKNSPAEEKSDD